MSVVDMLQWAVLWMGCIVLGIGVGMAFYFLVLRRLPRRF